MSINNNRRTPPFLGFSRGVPIVGQRPAEPPAGAYFYQVPVLIQRPGAGLEADSYEVRLPAPLEGVRFKALANDIATELAGVVVGGPKPKVILLSPFFLGFVPQEEMDRLDREAAAAAAAAGTPS